MLVFVVLLVVLSCVVCGFPRSSDAAPFGMASWARAWSGLCLCWYTENAVAIHAVPCMYAGRSVCGVTAALLLEAGPEGSASVTEVLRVLEYRSASLLVPCQNIFTGWAQHEMLGMHGYI